LANSDVSAAANAETGYRPELDGLRAIAILFVLFDHFGLFGFAGGFAGVDVFFVLSGFLITGQCARHGAQLTWARIGQFYLRRFWRIAPAYFVVVLATLAIGWRLMLVDDVARLGQWARGAAMFAVNFNPDSGYFAPAAMYTPLLHLWSLGVEAQFYLIWPLILRYALRRSLRVQFTVLAVIFVATLAASSLLSLFDPKAAFFAMPSRLWEFSVGAAVALAPPLAFRPRRQRRYDIAAALVLAFLLSTPFLFDSYVIWPAPLALVVVLPTAFLIYAARNPNSPAYLVLAFAPMAWTGRVSYSLYLVHWPLLTLATYAVYPTASMGLRATLLAASFGLGWLLNRFVETPLRKVWRSPRRWRWALVGAAAPVATYALAIALVVAGGGFVREGQGDEAAAVQAERRACRAEELGSLAHDGCLIGFAGVAPAAALWGDSHAGHLADPFAEAYAERRQSLLFFARNSCPPLPGLRVANNWLNARFSGRKTCEERNARFLAYVLATPSIRTLYIAGHWPAYVEAHRFGSETGSPFYLTSKQRPWASTDNSRALMQSSLIDLAKAVTDAGKTLVLIGSVPEMGFDAGRCAQLLAPAEAEARCRIARADVDVRQRATDAIFAAARAAVPSLRVVDLRAFMCGPESCPAVRDGVALYTDFHHVTKAGAAPIVAAAVAAADR